MLRANLEQLRDAILATGRLSSAEFDADLERLEADDLLVPSPILWTVWGRRPWPAADANAGVSGLPQDIELRR